MTTSSVDEPVGRVDPEGLQNATIADESGMSAIGRWFSDQWQSAKDWWNESPQPNQKDAIVGAADAAAKAGTVATETTDALKYTGGHADSKLVNALKTPAGSDALKVLKTGAQAANAIGLAQDAQGVITGFNQLEQSMGDLKSDVRSALTDPKNSAWEKFDGAEGGYWRPMFQGASSAGKAGVGLMTKP